MTSATASAARRRRFRSPATANPSPRITHVASLYTLGVAYSIAPVPIERFLKQNWATISKLLTDHGPWEGLDTIKQQPIRIQTTAHSLSLILGFLGTGPQNMMRYLNSKGLHGRLQELYQSGAEADLLSEENRCFAWDTGSGELRAERLPGQFRVKGPGVTQVGIAFVPAQQSVLNLSNGLLRLGYRSDVDMSHATIELKPVTDEATGRTPSPIEISIRIERTNGNERELQITLPATVGLTHIKEIVLTGEPGGSDRMVDLSITRFDFTPYS